MFNSIAVNGYFNFVKNVILPESPSNPNGFFYLPKNIYDPNMDFQQELKSYLVENNSSLNLSNRPWIAIVWNRGALEDSDEALNLRHANLLSKNLSNPDEPKGNVDKTRMGLCPLQVNYYSNSLDYLETFEEFIFVFLQDLTAFNVIFPNISTEPTSVRIKNFKVDDFSKELRTEQGELSFIQTSLSLVYPVSLRKQSNVSLVGQGKAKITYFIKNLSDPIR